MMRLLCCLLALILHSKSIMAEPYYPKKLTLHTTYKGKPLQRELSEDVLTSALNAASPETRNLSAAISFLEGGTTHGIHQSQKQTVSTRRKDSEIPALLRKFGREAEIAPEVEIPDEIISILLTPAGRAARLERSAQNQQLMLQDKKEKLIAQGKEPTNAAVAQQFRGRPKDSAYSQAIEVTLDSILTDPRNTAIKELLVSGPQPATSSTPTLVSPFDLIDYLMNRNR